MSTHQSIAPATPRFRIRPGALLTALGVVVAVAVAIVMLTLAGANHTVAIPRTAPQAGVNSAPQVQYLGPQQTRAGLNPTTIRGDASGAAAGGPAAHYSCLGAAQRCMR